MKLLLNLKNKYTDPSLLSINGDSWSPVSFVGSLKPFITHPLINQTDVKQSTV